jgi:pimeloyl-ACP methyl ester carboxylesterase
MKGNGPVIVLLHGYLSAGRYWDDICAELTEDHTVIAIDLLGFGHSPKPRDSSYDYTEHLAWIERTLKDAGSAKPVVMAGHSMGSLLALRYSRLHPDKVSRLFLFNLPLFEGKEQARRELVGTNLLFRATISWRMHHILVPILRTKVMKALMYHFTEIKFKQLIEYSLESTGISRDRSLTNVIEDQKAFEDLGHVSVPTTIVTGLAERQAYIKNVEKLEKRKNIHIILTDNTHHTPLENPQLIVDLLQQK